MQLDPTVIPSLFDRNAGSHEPGRIHFHELQIFRTGQIVEFEPCIGQYNEAFHYANAKLTEINRSDSSGFSVFHLTGICSADSMDSGYEYRAL